MTPNAVKLAEGKTVNGLTDADWDSYLDWEERCDTVQPILAQMDKQAYRINIRIALRVNGISPANTPQHFDRMVETIFFTLQPHLK